MDLRQLQNDASQFRRHLLIDADGGLRRLGDCLDNWQRDDFSALDHAWRCVAGQADDTAIRRAWLERPRGHSKTADIAVMATWALFASRRALKGVAAAGDRDQAALLRDAIETLRRANPWLREILDVQTSRVLNKHTGSELQILTSDAPTSYGLTPDFVVCDELTHWQKRDLWDSLLSSSAKRAACLLLVITNAGFQDSWQWETRELIRQDPASWYFSRLDGPQASWITADRLAEQSRLLPSIAYRRLWHNDWTSGSGDALAPSDITSAITLDGPTTEEEDGWAYVAGLDLGLSRDASALVVVAKHVGHVEVVEAKPRPLSRHQEIIRDLDLFADEDEYEGDYPEFIRHEGTGRLRLVDVQVWTPKQGRKLDIAPIERTILQAADRFEGLTVGADPWQAAYLIQRLNRANVFTRGVEFTGSNLRSMCSATLEAFAENMIDLYGHPQLISDLKSLRVEERNYGVRLVSPRGPSGHGDAATGLAIALHVATGIENTRPATINRPLLVA